jgi:hypothetical protein
MGTYDRAEIIEDRNSSKLRVFLFSGDERATGPVYALRSDFADMDIDETRAGITNKYGISPAQITKRIEGGRPPTRPHNSKPRGSSRK